MRDSFYYTLTDHGKIMLDAVDRWSDSGRIGPDPRGPPPATYGYIYSYTVLGWVRTQSS